MNQNEWKNMVVAGERKGDEKADGKSQWNWPLYYEKSEGRPPRKQLRCAVELCEEKRHALELGAGSLIDSKFLLENGFGKVTAVDSSEDIKNFARELNNQKLEAVVSNFRDYDFPKEEYDLVSAQYSLPFNGKEDFLELIKRISESLKLRGIFTGQLFGNHDDRNNGERNIAFHTKEEAERLFSDWEIVEFNGEENDVFSQFSGRKVHRHFFHFILRKK